MIFSVNPFQNLLANPFQQNQHSDRDRKHSVTMWNIKKLSHAFGRWEMPSRTPHRQNFLPCKNFFPQATKVAQFNIEKIGGSSNASRLFTFSLLTFILRYSIFADFFSVLFLLKHFFLKIILKFFFVIFTNIFRHFQFFSKITKTTD